MTKRPTSNTSNMERMLQEHAQQPPEAQTVKARPLRTPGKDKVSLTFNVSPAMYLKLQEIKITRGSSVQALLEEATDVWLKSLGETGFKPRDTD